MLAIVIALSLGGCTQALEQENARLTQRVTDLERASKRLEAENGTLKAENTRLKSEAEAARRAQAFSVYGWAPGKRLTATIVTSMGSIPCVLRPEQAPETVLNFVQLARGEREWTDPQGRTSTRALYPGTIFHRVIPGFMIQGGDPKGEGTGGPGYQFEDEVGEFTVFDHPGILAMANSGPDTNGSQFFVTDGTPTHLNGKHSIFGDCGGLDVVKAISLVERDRRDKPLTDVVIQRIDIAAE